MAGVEVRAEQIRTVYRQTGIVLLTSCVNTVIVSAVLWGSAPEAWLLGWIGLVLALSAARAWLGRSYLRAAPEPARAGPWGRRFALGSAGSGVLWGGAAFLFLREGGLLPELLVSFVIGGMCAAAAGTLASYFPAFLAFVSPALAALAVRLALFGDAPHGVMAALVFIYAGGLITVAKLNRRVLTEAFWLRFEKAQLLDQLAASQSQLEENNRTLEERVAERSEAMRQQGEALRDAQRLESVGRLAGSVAHDFNNLLTVILINISDLLQRSTVDEASKAILREVRDAANKSADLVRQLLIFSRRQRVALEKLDLNEVVRSMAEPLRLLVGGHLDLRMALHPAPLFVRGDSGQLQQLVTHLVTNARDASAGGGTVSVETELAEPAEPPEEVAPGSYAVLSVRDTGAGMDKATRERAFEPFFTTKALGKNTGLGLGLATAQSIVEHAGGQIRVSSEPGRGSCFRVYFALAEPSRQAPTEAHLRSSSGVRRAVKPNGSVTVLLVDDEPIVRAVARRLLESAGYRVLAAENADRALALSKQHPGPIELLVTDVVMPGLDGPELAARLRAERPGLRTLFISGYSQAHSVPSEDADAGIGFLAKPFTYDSLIGKVTQLLAAPAQGQQPASGDK